MRRKSTLFFFIVMKSVTIILLFVGISFVNAQNTVQKSKVSNELLRMVAEPAKQGVNLAPMKTPIAKEKLQISANNDLFRKSKNKILISAIAESDSDRLLAELVKLGLTSYSKNNRLVSGLISIDSISELNNVKELKFASPVYKPLTNSGVVLTNGDIALKSDTLRNIYGVDGSGVKIGVLSDSYNSLFTADSGIISGELPGIANPFGYNSEIEVYEDIVDGTDEGRAMMEIIHDVAPGSQLAFNSAFNGRIAFAEGILRLAEADCDIIVDDVVYLNEPFFQDGIIAQAVDKAVRKHKVSYFSSAGNHGRDSYESDFRTTGDTITMINPFEQQILGEYFLHDFDPGEGVDYFQEVTFMPYSQLLYSLQWDQPFASISDKSSGSANDLDIFLLLEEDPYTVVIQAWNENIGVDPYEIISAVNNGEDTLNAYIAIGKWIETEEPTPNPGKIKFVSFGDTKLNEYNTYSPSIFGHSNSRYVNSVGASAWFYTPEFGTTPPSINYFSSVGGNAIYMNIDGKIKRKPEIRRNPVYVATDGGNTSFFGQIFNDGDDFPNFFGTSASAPHAAGISALLYEMSGNYANKGLIDYCMKKSTIDMDDPYTIDFDKGYDFATGFGLIQADRAAKNLAKLIIEPISVVAECSVNPDETRNWTITNPNNFNVTVYWKIHNSNLTDSIIAFPGNNVLSTPTVAYCNLLIVSWESGRCHSFDAAHSVGNLCSPLKSAFASNDKIAEQTVTQIYPMPITEYFNVDIYSLSKQQINIQIYQMNGALIASELYDIHTGYNSLNINTSNFNNGSYLLKICDEKGEALKTTTIIK